MKRGNRIKEWGKAQRLAREWKARRTLALVAPISQPVRSWGKNNERLLRLPADNYERYELGPDNHVADFNAARYQNETTGFPVNREIWESVIALPTFVDGELVELALHPITLGFGEPAWVRGRPMLARGELGGKILRDLIERSAPYGTEIDVRDGVGYVRVR